MGRAQGKSELDSFVFAVDRLIVEEASEFGVLHDNGGVALDGNEIFLLESVAGFGRGENFAGEGDGDVRVGVGNALIAGESFIDADDEFGNIVEPGELGIVDDQAEKFAGGDDAMLFLVTAALHIEKRFVNAEKHLAKCDQFLARRSVSRISLIGIGIFGLVHVALPREN
jgi:hypothetical protein